MSLGVFWTAEAEKTFSDNLNYLEEKWNKKVIDSFIQKTEKAISLMAKNPELFPVISKRKKVRKCLVVKNKYLFTSVFIITKCIYLRFGIIPKIQND